MLEHLPQGPRLSFPLVLLSFWLVLFFCPFVLLTCPFVLSLVLSLVLFLLSFSVVLLSFSLVLLSFSLVLLSFSFVLSLVLSLVLFLLSFRLSFCPFALSLCPFALSCYPPCPLFHYRLTFKCPHCSSTFRHRSSKTDAHLGIPPVNLHYQTPKQCKRNVGSNRWTVPLSWMPEVVQYQGRYSQTLGAHRVRTRAV